jgi:hypothetical protein
MLKVGKQHKRDSVTGFVVGGHHVYMWDTEVLCFSIQLNHLQTASVLVCTLVVLTSYFTDQLLFNYIGQRIFILLVSVEKTESLRASGA